MTRYYVIYYGLFLLSLANLRVSADNGSDFNVARCRVRCLSQLHDPGGPGLPDVRNLNTLALCAQERDCIECMKPCSAPFVDLATCRTVCQADERACMQSCQFLQRMSTVKTGECPAPNTATGFDAACVTACEDDHDCRANQKCCSNGCGFTCRNSLELEHGLPVIPPPPGVKERPKGNSMEVFWNDVSSPSLGPVLYVLQWKWNVGKHHSEHHMTTWTQVAQIAKTSHVVRQVDAGKWYVFRIASVNVNGTRGFSDESEAATLSREPQAPGQPTNITEVSMKVVSGQVSVTISWQPPRKTDLPITRYKIFWSKRLRRVTAQLEYLQEHRKIMKGDEHEFEIPNLEPDTTYFVQIQAISQYGDVRLKSERMSAFISTLPTVQALPHQVEEPRTTTPLTPRLPTPPPIDDLKALAPFFQNGLTKANITWTLPTDEGSQVTKTLIHWQPEVCIADSSIDENFSSMMSATTHSSFFVIYDLRFGCRYLVKVQSVSMEHQVGPVVHVTFNTPACSDIEVKGDVQPDCPTNIPRVPDMPKNLQYSFLISQSNITAQMTWEHPLSDAPIQGYRIIWGQTLDESEAGESPRMDQNTALTKVLPKQNPSIGIGNLKEGVTYLVRLQAFSRAGSSSVASIHYTTPRLHHVPIDPRYKTVTGKGDVPVYAPTPPPRNHHSNKVTDQLNRHDDIDDKDFDQNGQFSQGQHETQLHSKAQTLYLDYSVVVLLGLFTYIVQSWAQV